MAQKLPILGGCEWVSACRYLRLIKREEKFMGIINVLLAPSMIILFWSDDLCAEARLRKKSTQYVEIGNLSHLLSKDSET